MLDFASMSWGEVLQLRAAVNRYVAEHRPAVRERARALREELARSRVKVGGRGPAAGKPKRKKAAK